MTNNKTRLPDWLQRLSKEATGGPAMPFEEWQTKTTDAIGIPSLGVCGGAPEDFQRDHWRMGTTPEVFAYYVLVTVKKRMGQASGELQ